MQHVPSPFAGTEVPLLHREPIIFLQTCLCDWALCWLVVCLSKACKHDSLVSGVQNQPCTFYKLKIDSTKVHSIAPSQGQEAKGGIQRALGVCHYLSPLHHLSAGDPPLAGMSVWDLKPGPKPAPARRLTTFAYAH